MTDHKQTWPKLCSCGDPGDEKVGNVYMCRDCHRRFINDFCYYMEIENGSQEIESK